MRKAGKPTLKCYDFGGQVSLNSLPQEIFYPTHEFFMSSKAIYVVTVDASRYENRALRFWLKKIRQYASKPCVFVVATHADLLPNSALR